MSDEQGFYSEIIREQDTLRAKLAEANAEITRLKTFHIEDMRVTNKSADYHIKANTVLIGKLAEAERQNKAMRDLLLRIAAISFSDENPSMQDMRNRKAIISILEGSEQDTGRIDGVQRVQGGEGKSKESEARSETSGIGPVSGKALPRGQPGEGAQALPEIPKTLRVEKGREPTEGELQAKTSVCGISRQDSKTEALSDLRSERSDTSRTPQGLQQTDGGSMAVLDLSWERAQSLILSTPTTPPKGEAR